ncbi:MAG: cobaltochelatase subunit CobN, partial [Jhaorihella sp.]
GEVLAELPPVALIPDQGAYHPDYEGQFSANPDNILRALGHRPGQAIIALGFHNRYLKADALSHIDALVEKIRARGAFALPVFYSLGPDARLVDLLKGRANVLIHMQPVYHNGFEAQLNALGIPVMQGIGRWNDSAEGWQQDPVGLSLSATPLYLALPEQNGLIDPMMLWSEKAGELSLIDYQAEAALDKAVKLARLQMTALAEQKLAVMVYNYPPGERNLSASFMNVPRSLAGLSGQWLAAGYSTRELSEQAFIDGLGAAIQASTQAASQGEAPVSAAAASRSSLSLQAYLAWFAQLPASVQQRINDYWGEPAKSPMLALVDGEQAFPIHHLDAGNIIYLGQPARGRPGMSSERQLYHDMRVPVTHYYLATYLWLRDHFKAHALVQFGTHGTQEWMPVKERGLSIYDDPLLALGDIPVIYPYIIDNVGEATQAKRRGRAVMISHQTPPFRPSGLHGVLVDMHQLIHQWENLEAGEVKDNTLASLLAMAQDNELATDLKWSIADINERPADFVQRLHDYLHELADAAQPMGLHTFAGDALYEQKLTTVLQMLGEDFIAAFNLAQPDELYAGDYRDLASTAPYHWLDRVLAADAERQPEPALGDWQMLARQYYERLDSAPEWAGLSAALRAQHIAPGIGGDPVRVPDSLPSGKNLVGFDPARVPTKEAWAVGKQAIDELIAKHRDEHGQWPQRLAFSLWAVEAMRHGGILESQALYAMGVEPVWDRAGRVDGYTIVSREALGRPRVDVVLSVTGLYRDQFPNVMKHLAEAAAEISQLDENDNPLHEHTRMLLADLMARGIPQDEALPMAQTRVFGSPTGVYGTGLEDAALASDTWESEDKLAELYLQRMSHAFGPDSSRWSEAPDSSDLYAEYLKSVDVALLARTSNLYGMLTTDDPFQYLGGIDLAVRHLRGKSPELYISNQR